MAKHQDMCRRAKNGALTSIGILAASSVLVAKPTTIGVVNENGVRAIGIGGLVLGAYLTYKSAKHIKKKCY